MGIGKGVAEAGQGAFSLGEFYEKAATDDQINTTMKFADQLRFGDPSKMKTLPDGTQVPDTGFFGLRGADAQKAYGPAIQSLDDYIKQARSNLGTPAQQLEFDIQTRRMRSNWATEMGRHTEAQSKVWMTGVNDAAYSLSLDAAARDAEDPVQALHHTADATNFLTKNAQLVYGVNGITPEMQENIQHQAVAKVTQTRVEALMNTNPVLAQSILDAHKNDFDPKVYDVLANRLVPVVAEAHAADLMSGVPLPPGAESVSAALLGQESNNNPNVRTSDKNAHGIGQITPDTFNAYAKPGERIDVPKDNLAVHKRIIADYYQRYNGDPARIAVAYFSGPGNVAPPGSPTPWLKDKSDGHKLTSSYVSDVIGRIRNQGPPAANENAVALGSAPSANSVESGPSAEPNQGPGAAPPGSEPPPRFLTDADVARVGANLGGAPADASQPAPSAGPPGAPDRGALIKQAEQLYGNNPKMLRAVISAISRKSAEFNAANSADIYTLKQHLPDVVAAAEDGVQGLTFPEEKVNSLLPPAQAQHWREEFNVAQHVGDVMRAVQWASPDEVAALQADLSSGQGYLSTLMRTHRNAPTSGPGAVGADPDADEASFMRLRAGAARRLDAQLGKRWSMLNGPNADPAAYVLSNPTVQAAGAALDQKDPASIMRYVNATLGVQEHLGVPEGQRHVLPKAQAARLASSVMAPGGDAKGALDKMQAQYGPAYDQVFSDMVTLGALPPAYQSVHALEDPRDAAEMSAAIALGRPTKTGQPPKTLTDLITPDIANPIKKAVSTDPALTEFKKSLFMSGASPEQIDGIVGSVETLALYKSYHNGDSNAAANAVKAFTGNYEYMPNGGARVPSARMPAVSENARVLLDGMSPNNVAVPAAFEPAGLPSNQERGLPAQADYLAKVKANPTWITSKREDALMLMDWQGRLVRGRDGTPLSVPFSAGPPAQRPGTGGGEAFEAGP